MRNKALAIGLCTVCILLSACKKEEKQNLNEIDPEAYRQSLIEEGYNTEYVESLPVGVYEEAQPRRDSQADVRIIPESYDYIDENGRVYCREIYEQTSRIVIDRDSITGKDPIKRIDIYPDGTERIHEKTEYKYNSDGTISRSAAYYNTGIDEDECVCCDIMDYEYRNGKLSKVIYTSIGQDGEQVPNGFTVYSYDLYGAPMKATSYIDSAVQEYELYKCNSNGEVIRAENYYYNDVLYDVTEYKYREDGQIEAIYEYGTGDEVISSMQYQYDSKDYLRRIITTAKNLQKESEDEPDEYVQTIEVHYADTDLSSLGELVQDGQELD